MHQLAYIFLALTVLINIFFGLAVLLRVYQKPFGWYFVLTVFGVILWAVGDAGMLFARSPTPVRAFADLIAHSLEFRLKAERAERFLPSHGVDVDGIDQCAVDIKKDRLDHGCS